MIVFFPLDGLTPKKYEVGGIESVHTVGNLLKPLHILYYFYHFVRRHDVKVYENVITVN